MTRRRQRSSWGCVTRIDRDRYRLRWWEVRDGLYERRSSTVRGTRKEAERRLAEIRAGLNESERGARRVGRIRTVGECYEEWWHPSALRKVETGAVATQTLRQAESAWRRHVAPRWANVRVDDVQPLDVQRWLMGMTKMPARSALSLLRRILDLAQLYGQVSANVARARYDLPDQQRSCPEGAYTLDEVDEITQALRGTAAFVPAILCGLGSCRVGEALGVATEDVSFCRRSGMVIAVIEVHRQVRSDGQVSEKLKNRWSERVIAIPEPWSIDLMDAASANVSAGEPWACPDGSGCPVSQFSCRKAWDRAFGEGSPLHHLPHRQMRALRRSWETMMRWTLGVPPEKVEKMMGHVGAGVTGRHYDRPDAESIIDTVAQAFSSRPFVRKS